MREGNELVRATKVYASENRWLSWWHLGSTLTVAIALVFAVCQDWPWFVRLPCSVLEGLVLVRLFIIYHDYQHGTILKGSPFAGFLMMLYGLATLTPASIWNRSHNHHHGNNAKIFGAQIGSYPVMTTESYASASPTQRFLYALSRHPLTIGLGYLTIFFYGMCLRSLIVSPRKHFDSAVSIVLHAGLIVWLALAGPDILVLAVILPMTIGSAIGAYLFYAQHNYPAVKLRARAEWDFVFAALKSSSFIRMSPWMSWFTGNIGYHHVHHLNPHIPFYRLPEAMSGIEELQSPVTISLKPKDIYRCFRLKLWDPARDQMVTFRGAV